MTEVELDDRNAAHSARSTGMRLAALPALLAIMLPACSAPPAAAPGPHASACVIVDDQAHEEITIGVSGPAVNDVVGARATAERLISAQVFETLVRVDCAGAAIAGLAAVWSSQDMRTWRFRVKPGAMFHDGMPVTARTIAQAWSAARVPAIAAVTAAGDMDLIVTLVAAADAHVFADPALAVLRPTAGGPIGTGPFRPDADADDLRIVRVADAGAPRFISVRVFAGDARNALDAGVDALVTGDAAVLAYARARPDYAAAPLPWSRTYVLATRGQGGSRPSSDVLTALARDAVRGDARGAQAPFWWEECRLDSMPAPDDVRAADANSVVYPEGDLIARGLAERLVALAWPTSRAPAWLRDLLPADYGRGTAPSARGLDRDDLTAAINGRAALAVIAPVTRPSHAGCARVVAATRDDPGSIAEALLTAGASWTITPMLDARDHLIHRPGLGRVTVDADGTIRFAAGS